jgi:CrcB protein
VVGRAVGVTGPWWAVALGALVGAPGRYLLDSALRARLGDAWPWGTLAVNLLGSSAAGVLAGLAASGRAGPGVVTLLGAGLLGSFTTASALAVEAVALVSVARRRDAVTYVAASVALGVLLAAAGFYCSGGTGS